MLMTQVCLFSETFISSHFPATSFAMIRIQFETCSPGGTLFAVSDTIQDELAGLALHLQPFFIFSSSAAR